MGLDLASFGAGFFGQAVKDREADKEEERLARRQAMLNKLQEESAIRTAQRKTTAGTPYKVGDKYYVQDTDGDGNIKGPAREARPDEVRAYEDGDLDRRTKVASTTTAEFSATKAPEAWKLDKEGKELSNQQTRQEMQLSRNRDARAAIEHKNSNSPSNDTKKKMEEIRDLQLRAEAAIEELPDTPESKAVKTTYNAEVNGGVANQVGFVEMRRRLNRVLATARGMNSRAAKDKGTDAPPTLDPFINPPYVNPVRK